jgi:DNA-nicking Smr family endonuclease
VRDADKAVWEKYVEDVTPLGQIPPSTSEVAVERVILSRRLDLHGLSVAEAHTATMNFIEAATDRSVTVVTGLSGAIRQEFPCWFERMPHLRIEERNGGGAFAVHFRRKRKRDVGKK